MTISYRLLLGAGLLSGLAACSDSPPVERRFTSAQLAWQPYQVGQVLRFGQARATKVRTFRVLEVTDELLEYSQGGSAPVYLGRPTKYKLQHIIAAAQRTDTLRYVQTGASTPTHPDSVLLGSTGLLDWGVDAVTGDVYAAVGWDGGFYHALPLRELYRGLASVDTTQHLLPTVRVGGIAYDSVFRLTQSAAAINSGAVPRSKPARLLYYAKGYGVVGFVEGNTLWYRLP